MRRVFRLLALALGLGLAVSTAGGTEPARTRAANEKPLALGFVASMRGEAALDRIEPFRRRLSDALMVDVRAVRFADEPALIEAVAAGRIDYAPMSALGYATARRLCDCVEPLAVPRAADGTAGYRAIVLARKGGPITAVADLAGRSLAVSPERSIAGRRLPLLLLAAEGLGGAKQPHLETVDGPRAAVRALMAGRVDAAVAWSSLDGDLVEGYGRGTLHDMVAAGELRMADVRVVWSSPDLPHGPQVITTRFDEARRRRIREMLIELADLDPDAYEAIEPTHGGGFLRVGASAYGPFLKLVTPQPSSDGSHEPATGSEPPTTGATRSVD